MTLQKTYIGKGKQVKDFEMVDVTVKWNDLEKHVFEYEGEKFLRFTVAKMKEPDQYERTHTVYVTEKVPEESPKKGRTKK